MKTPTILSIAGAMMLILFIGGGAAFASGECGRGIDEILDEIRDVEGIGHSASIDPNLVSVESLEELGEAVMDFMHPNRREHEPVDQILGVGWDMHNRRGRGGYGMLPGAMMGGPWLFFVWRIVMWIVILGIVGVVIWLIVRTQKQQGSRGWPQGESPLDIAKKRYARGEISREEYENLKRDLQ
jgi:putative membrane protein